MTATRQRSKRKKTGKRKPLATIWEVPDALWERVLPILQEFWPTQRTGRHHADWRRALNGIIFRMRSGCQWEQLPRKFGPKSTVHDWFQRWCQGGVMQRIWAELAKECDELGAVHWRWQAADGRLGKARFGGEKGGEKPHGSGEKGHQAKPVGGTRRWPAGGRDRGGQRQRPEVIARDDRGDRHRPAAADERQ